MKNVKTKILSLLLVIVCTLSILSLSSCNKKYDEEEVLTAAKTLLKEAELLNVIYYGSGVQYYENDRANGNYREANSEHLRELGFSTVDELMILTEKTFSDNYSDLLYSTIIYGLKDDTSVITAARYYQAYDEETNDSYMMVNSKFTVMFKDSIEYDYNSLKVEKSSKEKVYVSVEATVTNSEGASQKTTVTITLVEEDDGWKIDNPTYANYNSLKDRYDELKDQKIK